MSSDKTTEKSILKKATPVAETDDYITALIYGRAGSGKTTFSASFPKPILLLDVMDKGTDSIKDVPGIDVISITNWLDFEAVYWGLVNEKHGYQTIVIDTISNMQDLAIEEVKRRDGRDKDDSLSQRGWGDVTRIMSQWIYNYRDLPMHVVFLSQERVKRGSEDEMNYDDQLDPEVGPAVTPSVSKTLTAAVKVIGNTFIKQSQFPSKKTPGKMVTETAYMLRVGPHPYYITKIRSPKNFKTPGSIKNGGYDQIRALMRGEKEA